MASPLLEHMGDYYGGGNFVGYHGAVGLCLTGTRIPCRVGVPCASPAQCSGVRTGVGARHGEPVGDHSDGGNFVGYHNTAGLRVGRGQPVRVTNRYADHAVARGRKVGVPLHPSPRWVSPSPRWVSPYHHIAGLRAGRGQPVRVTNRDADHARTCGRKVGVPKVGVPKVGSPRWKTCGRKVGVPEVGVPFRKNLLILRMILV